MGFLLEAVAFDVVDIFVHDNLYLPNFQKLHGSSSYEVEAAPYFDIGYFTLWNQKFELTRNKWETLDTQNERCAKSALKGNTGECITE